MPHKTKKQKLKTNHNRQQEEHVTETNSLPTFSFTKTSHVTTTRSTAAETEGLVYLRKDLLKTVVLAVVCCGVLIALSFVLK